VGRGHLALPASLVVAFALAAAEPAAAALHWREIGRGPAVSAPAGAPTAVVVASAARARSLDRDLPAPGRSTLAVVDWKTTVVVVILAHFGCTDERVAVTGITRRGDILAVALVKRPLPPDTVECQAIFPTYRLLALSRVGLGAPAPTRATAAWVTARSLSWTRVALGLTTPTGAQQPRGSVAASRAQESAWLARVAVPDRRAVTSVDFGRNVAVAVFLDGAPCASNVATTAVERQGTELTVHVVYTRPRVGVATCIRTSITYLVLAVPRAGLSAPLPSRVAVVANARA